MVRALIALVMGLTVMMPGIPMTTSQWLGRVSSMGANTDSEQSKVHEIKRDTGITQTLVEYEPTVMNGVHACGALRMVCFVFAPSRAIAVNWVPRMAVRKELLGTEGM